MSALRYLLVLLSVLFLVLPSAALNGAVSREVIPEGDGIYRVTLQVSHLPMVGIVETLPEGASYEGSSLPLSQVKIQDRHVAFVIRSQSIVQYTVRSLSSQKMNIGGIWEDLLQGERGYVQNLATPSLTPATPAAITPSPTRAVMGEILPAGALVLGALLVLWYREGCR